MFRSIPVLAVALALAGLAACKADRPVSQQPDSTSDATAVLATPGGPAPADVASPTPPVAALAVAQSPRPVASVSPEAELHVIGIQAGAHPPGADTRPWWQKCGAGPNSPPSAECHQRYAGQRAKGFATVNVTLTGVPLILVLRGGEPVEWTLNIESGARVEKVILAGSYAQEIATLDRPIPIEIHGPHFSCESCTQIGSGFAVYDERAQAYPVIMRRLKEITGRSPSSIQFARQAGTGPFYVSSSIVHYTQLPEAFRRWEQ